MQKKNNNDFMLSVELHPKIVVSDVRPNSPAQAAEILPGDELIKINNRFTYKLKLRDIKNMLSEEDGKKIKLEFKRGEEVIKKEIYLRDRFKELLQNSKN
jgi:C-terminal processing protease CtpA/Prc